MLVGVLLGCNRVLDLLRKGCYGVLGGCCCWGVARECCCVVAMVFWLFARVLLGFSECLMFYFVVAMVFWLIAGVLLGCSE